MVIEIRVREMPDLVHGHFPFLARVLDKHRAHARAHVVQVLHKREAGGVATLKLSVQFVTRGSNSTRSSVRRASFTVDMGTMPA